MKQIGKTLLTICGIFIANLIGIGAYLLFCLCVHVERIYMYVKLANVILLVINLIFLVVNLKLMYDKTKDNIRDRMMNEDNAKGWQI